MGVPIVIVALLFFAASWESRSLPGLLFTGETARKPLPATMPGGIAVFDADGDGLLDLFFPNGAPLPGARKLLPAQQNRFFRNLGGMRFAERSSSSGLAGTGYDFAAAAADYDGDGRTDLVVCGLRGLTLYRNLGEGRFADVTPQSGLQNPGRWSVGAAWLDYDRDGDLDLFVVHYVAWDPATEKACLVEGRPDFCHPKHYPPQANALFRNEGGGKFRDVSAESGIAAHRGKGMAVAVADFDGDSWPDLFVTNDRVFNFYFRNLGNGQFAEEGFARGVAAPLSGTPPSAMGADAQDFDGDGRPDLVYTALRDETFPLYRNTGAEFLEVTEATQLAARTRPMSGWSVVFADLDNDTWLDLAVARGDALSATGPRAGAVQEPVSWLRNLGGKTFAAAQDLPGAPALHRGLLAADFDLDGCLDLVATRLQSTPLLWKNPCAGKWLAVRVPVGARVRVGERWQHFRSSTRGYASSCDCPLHFGLGSAAEADVEVFWPDGRKTLLPRQAAGQRLEPRP